MLEYTYKKNKMPQSENIDDYKKQIHQLNKEVQALKGNLQKEQITSNSYQEKINEAKERFMDAKPAKEINPILKQIKNKSLSSLERRNLIFPNLSPSNPKEIIYQWVAPARLTVTRDKQWYWTMALIIAIMTTFSLILREVIWIAVIFSFFFVIFIQVSIPPGNVLYKLTKNGIEIGEGEALEMYSWDQMLEYSYYFKHNTEVVYVYTILPMPNKLVLMFNQEDRKNIDIILQSMLPYKPPPKKQNFITKSMDGIYIPYESFKELQEKIDSFFEEKYHEIIKELKDEGRVGDNVNVADIKKAKAIETISIMEKLKDKEKVKEALDL